MSAGSAIKALEGEVKGLKEEIRKIRRQMNTLIEAEKARNDLKRAELGLIEIQEDDSQED